MEGERLELEMCAAARELNLQHLALVDVLRCPYAHAPWAQLGGCGDTHKHQLAVGDGSTPMAMR